MQTAEVHSSVFGWGRTADSAGIDERASEGYLLHSRSGCVRRKWISLKIGRWVCRERKCVEKARGWQEREALVCVQFIFLCCRGLLRVRRQRRRRRWRGTEFAAGSFHGLDVEVRQVGRMGRGRPAEAVPGRRRGWARGAEVAGRRRRRRKVGELSARARVRGRHAVHVWRRRGHVRVAVHLQCVRGKI